MVRLLRFIWKLFIMASVFGIGYIIGREHSFEEDEDWDEEEFEDKDKDKIQDKPEEAKPAAATEAPVAGTPAPAGDTRDMTFTYENAQAATVSVVGDFNDWNKDANPMTNTDGVWKASVKLAPGRHEYKFVLNNTDWLLDPKCGEKVPDKHGSESSVVVVP